MALGSAAVRHPQSPSPSRRQIADSHFELCNRSGRARDEVRNSKSRLFLVAKFAFRNSKLLLPVSPILRFTGVSPNERRLMARYFGQEIFSVEYQASVLTFTPRYPGNGKDTWDATPPISHGQRI
jgi:hypothetical protein